MGFKNTSSLVVIAAAILLSFFYIRPALATIGEIQDQIFLYRDNADKAAEVNSRLRDLRNQIDSFRQSDIVALETFLPTSTDVLQVMFDVETIATASNLTVTDVSSVESEQSSNLEDADIQNLDISEEDREVLTSLQTVDQVDVEASMTGSYENFKLFLDTIAYNDYPLEVVNLEFGDNASDELQGGQGGTDLSYTVTLRTYAFNYVRNR